MDGGSPALLRLLNRYRYGTDHCPGDRLPKDALEEAVIEQMLEVYADSSLIEQTFAAAVKDGEPDEDFACRLTGVKQELAGAKHSLDRCFAAFEEGSLSPADFQEQISKLTARIDALSAEKASLTQRVQKAAQRLRAPSTLRSGRGILGRSFGPGRSSSARRFSVCS